MPNTFKDADGNEVSAFTVEEVEALKSEKDQELKAAQEEAEKVKEELSKLQAKDLNFANLRSQKEDADKKVKALKEEVEGIGPKMEKLKEEIVAGVFKDHYEERLAALASGDEELAKKISYQYKRLAGDVSSKTEIDKKLQDAVLLAQGPSTKVSGNAFASMGSAPMRPASSSGAKFSEEEKAFAKTFAAAGGIKLSEDDIKKL